MKGQHRRSPASRPVSVTAVAGRTVAAAGIAAAALVSVPAEAAGPVGPRGLQPAAAAACTAADTLEVGPAYYGIDLRPTASSYGARSPGGHVRVSYPSSPFALPLDAEGRLVQRLRVDVAERVRARAGRLVAWAAAPDLDPVHRLGEIGEDGSVTGEVALNKFLVFVTEEPAGEELADRWRGPVVLKGKSRSGRMQSVAGHGLEPEPC